MGLWHVVPGLHIRGEQVVGDDARQEPEPELRQGGQDLALPGDSLVHHHVERGDAVGGDQEQVIAQQVEVAHLAGADPLGERQVRGEDGVGQRCFLAQRSAGEWRMS